MPSALRKNSSDSETGLQNINEEPRKRIGPSRVKELAKFFTPSSDEEDQSRVNNRTRRKRLSNLKRRREKVKRNKQSDFKAKTRSLKDNAIFRSIIVILLPVTS